MSVQRHSRLNQLLHELPEGYVADTAWLKGLGLSASSIQGYVRQGWLEHLAPKLYRRSDPTLQTQGPLRWEICLLSLQNVLKRPVHAGGQTALELAGYWQYAMLGRRRVWLYTEDPRARGILGRAPLDAVAKPRTTKLFTDPSLGLETRVLDLVTSTLSAAAVPANARSPGWKQQLTTSSLERAILEVLAEIPGSISFEHGGELFEGLTTLRPSPMRDLLLSCTSIKAKRLFFYFSQRHRGLRKRLNPEDFDLGSGKRQIVPGGRYDAQFQITVPRRRGQ
jgi:hypothetical protein